jgi:taurine dioxygenase
MGLEIQKVTPLVGAVASGIDLARPLEPETVQTVRRAVLEHGVVFFRDQDLTHPQMVSFMKNFGPLCTDPFSMHSLQNPPEEETVINMPTTAYARATAIWHLDSTLAAEPASMIALRAIELPPSGGGDTCWANMYEAYETLSAPIRDLIDGLTAEHSAYKTLPLMGMRKSEFLQDDMRNVHPVVRVNPETGRKSLFANELWTETIVGLSQTESDYLLGLLFKHAATVEFSMRWKWRVNDLALWDNRSFSHYAVRDYTGNRVLQKSLVKGDRPYGPNAKLH